MSEKSQEKQTKKKGCPQRERYATRSPRLRLEEDIETQA